MNTEVNLTGRVLKMDGKELYELGEHVGGGSFGAVYRAVKLDTGREYAVKIVGSSHEARLEPRICATLKHPSVVHYHAFGEDQGVGYVVMDLLEGYSLQQLREQGLWNDWYLYRLVTDVGGALHEAHGKLIVHRDLKPANIIFAYPGTSSQRFVILDWGIASKLDAQGTLRADYLKGAGTIEYMSLEQIRGDDPEPAFDVYSLGVILYEMITGQVPLPYEHENVLAYRDALENFSPPVFTQLRPEMDRESFEYRLQHIVLKCLDANPQRRPRVSQVIDTVQTAYTTTAHEESQVIRAHRSDQSTESFPADNQDSITELPPGATHPPIPGAEHVTATEPRQTEPTDAPSPARTELPPVSAPVASAPVASEPVASATPDAQQPDVTQRPDRGHAILDGTRPGAANWPAAPGEMQPGARENVTLKPGSPADSPPADSPPAADQPFEERNDLPASGGPRAGAGISPPASVAPPPSTSNWKLVTIIGSGLLGFLLCLAALGLFVRQRQLMEFDGRISDAVSRQDFAEAITLTQQPPFPLSLTLDESDRLQEICDRACAYAESLVAAERHAEALSSYRTLQAALQAVDAPETSQARISRRIRELQTERQGAPHVVATATPDRARPQPSESSTSAPDPGTRPTDSSGEADADSLSQTVTVTASAAARAARIRSIRDLATEERFERALGQLDALLVDVRADPQQRAVFEAYRGQLCLKAARMAAERSQWQAVSQWCERGRDDLPRSQMREWTELWVRSRLALQDEASIITALEQNRLLEDESLQPLYDAAHLRQLDRELDDFDELDDPDQLELTSVFCRLREIRERLAEPAAEADAVAERLFQAVMQRVEERLTSITWHVGARIAENAAADVDGLLRRELAMAADLVDAAAPSAELTRLRTVQVRLMRGLLRDMLPQPDREGARADLEWLATHPIDGFERLQAYAALKLAWLQLTHEPTRALAAARRNLQLAVTILDQPGWQQRLQKEDRFWLQWLGLRPANDRQWLETLQEWFLSERVRVETLLKVLEREADDTYVLTAGLRTRTGLLTRRVTTLRSLPDNSLAETIEHVAGLCESELEGYNEGKLPLDTRDPITVPTPDSFSCETLQQ